MMAIIILMLVSFAAGCLVGGAYAFHQVRQRKAYADKTRFLMTRTVPHCPEEDAIRRAGV